MICQHIPQHVRYQPVWNETTVWYHVLSKIVSLTWFLLHQIRHDDFVPGGFMSLQTHTQTQRHTHTAMNTHSTALLEKLYLSLRFPSVACSMNNEWILCILFIFPFIGLLTMTMYLIQSAPRNSYWLLSCSKRNPITVGEKLWVSSALQQSDWSQIINVNELAKPMLQDEHWRSVKITCVGVSVFLSVFYQTVFCFSPTEFSLVQCVHRDWICLQLVIMNAFD